MPRKATKTKGRQPPTYFKKEQVWQLYVLWKALPFHLRGVAVKDLDQLGVDRDDEVLRELAAIKTQGAFAKKYGLDRATLTRWNKAIDERDALGDVRNFAKRLTKNVIMAHYKGATSQSRTASADRKLWYQFIEKWNEQFELGEETRDSLADLLTHARKRK